MASAVRSQGAKRRVIGEGASLARAVLKLSQLFLHVLYLAFCVLGIVDVKT